uniref:tRNA wybutosine-synthesizing protein 2 homolog n=1 Tax=Myxine glutinosa TaxID=7769 RepID=UPI00358E2EA6
MAGKCLALVVPAGHAQRVRTLLKQRGWLNPTFRVVRNEDGSTSIPVISCDVSDWLVLLSEAGLESNKKLGTPDWRLVEGIEFPLCRHSPSPHERLFKAVSSILELHRDGPELPPDWRDQLPRRWERHGDLAIVDQQAFASPFWDSFAPELWTAVTKALGVRRLAKQGRVQPDGFRTPTVTLLLGSDGLVERRENGISYTWDICTCMFSTGNAQEKQRAAMWDCTGETVCDMYAGIGYFTLPVLVHGRAKLVLACEWNPNALHWLSVNLQRNGVSNRCRVLPGDNRKLSLDEEVDRVLMGILPQDPAALPVACNLLRRDRGGRIHLHLTVTSFPEATRSDKRTTWLAAAQSEAQRVETLLDESRAGKWKAVVEDVFRVKSYAPHMTHVVADILCRPH